jgi:predicted DCC family thiol-disulfide oxidoreductase YuxK
LNTFETNSPLPTAIILFDGVCNLCESSVQMVLKNDPEGYFHFASLQGPVGQQLLQQYQLQGNDMKSFVLIEDGKAYTRSTAALRVTRKMKMPWRLLSPLIILPAFIRNAVYDFIAANRYRWFGEKTECWMPRPEWKKRFLD